MVYFGDVDVTFSELPNEVSLTISIMGCGNNCKGCHSPHLRGEGGKLLDIDTLQEYLTEYAEYITAVTFLGGDNNNALVGLLDYIKTQYPQLKLCIYSGNNSIPEDMEVYLDYLKLGSYIEELGGLSSPLTNQVMYKLTDNGYEDITYKFRRTYNVKL